MRDTSSRCTMKASETSPTKPRKYCERMKRNQRPATGDGRAKPHGAGFAGVVSYHIREPEDVPGVVELFRMSYERAKESAERRKEGPSARTPTTSGAKEAPSR